MRIFALFSVLALAVADEQPITWNACGTDHFGVQQVTGEGTIIALCTAMLSAVRGVLGYGLESSYPSSIGRDLVE
jgi:hypothetical protein